MPGGNAPKPPHSDPSNHRKSRWESSAAASSKSKPSPNSAAIPPAPNNKGSNRPLPQPPKPGPENPSPRPGNPNSAAGPSSVYPFNDPPPPPSYGFHMLDRRSIVLADGSVRSYFALLPDYENFAHMPRPAHRPGFIAQSEVGLDRPPFPMSPDFLRPDGRARNPNVGLENSLKRKFGEDERGGRDDGFDRQRQQLLQYGNVNGPGPSVGYGLGRGGDMRAAKNMRYNEGSSSKLRHSEVDQNALKVAFLHFVKLVFETPNQKKSFLMDGKQGPLPCLACRRFDLLKVLTGNTLLLHYNFIGVIVELLTDKSPLLALCDSTELYMSRPTILLLDRDIEFNFKMYIVLVRSSKDFPDVHSLVMHAYNSESAGSLVDHLAFHKALCILMGWNYLTQPNNSKAYQNLSADDAETNIDDLIVWPPTVLIHNTITGKNSEGRMEGLGNRAMDSMLRDESSSMLFNILVRFGDGNELLVHVAGQYAFILAAKLLVACFSLCDLGFTSGKSMSLFAREGHLGMHAVKFAGDESGLKEARRLADYFERQRQGRKSWAHLQPLTLAKEDEKNPNLVKLDPRTGEKKRVFYGHLATVADLDKITFELKKKVSIVSARELTHRT
ncbi:hypothetical protein SASPL_100430 [Salvia splendens]|uniref:XS domain-containing protein n=1 Tax=Salvia splendens TaxID=180675 RepID=A0A8X8YSP6_SALSN|nr:hypothetical protein SASPL_100430 [Salvia splendens]